MIPAATGSCGTVTVIYALCRGSQEQVHHLDVENELLEAMSDTVSNRTRPEGEYSRGEGGGTRPEVE